MSIHIQARGFSLTRAMRDAVQSSLAEIVERNQQVMLVNVRLEDINGPQHGGIDKRCQVVLQLAHAPSVIIRSTQNDMYLAIKHCASRVKHSIGRLNSKQRNRICSTHPKTPATEGF